MVTLFYLVCFGLGIGLGFLIRISQKSKCNHKWKLIDSGNIWRGSQKNVRGWVKVYECEHCKKMKKEQVEID